MPVNLSKFPLATSFLYDAPRMIGTHGHHSQTIARYVAMGLTGQALQLASRYTTRYGL